MSHVQDEEATISFPSIAIVAIVCFVVYRFFIAKNPSTSGNVGSSSRGGMRFTAAQVEQVAQMFPQLNRRDIMWDLQRNRGSVQATTERVLTGRGLDPAPPTFQPSLAAAPMTTTTPIASTTGAARIHPDLITRYNLQSRINSKGKEREEDSMGSGWANTKEARQSALQKRRDEMILAARRKLMEKDASSSI